MICIQSRFSVAMGFIVLSVALVARGQEAAIPGHEHPIQVVAFSPDGKFIASADQYGVTLLLEAATGKVIRQLGRYSTVGIAFTPQGRLATVDRRRLQLYNVMTGEREAEVRPDQSSPIKAMAVSPDGLLVAFGHLDGNIRVHGLPRGDPAATLAGHKQEVSELAPDGEKPVHWSTRLA